MRYAKLSVLLSLTLLSSCSLAPAPSQGQGNRAYSWIDANGQMHMGVIPGGGTAAAPDDNKPAAPATTPVMASAAEGKPAPAAATAVTTVVSSGTSTVVAGSNAAAQPAAGHAAPLAASQDVFAPDDEFVDSKALEKKNFNLDGKKKFAEVVDASGHIDQVYYDRGEGVAAPDAASAPNLPDVYPVLPVLPDDAAWPLRQTLDNCCKAWVARKKPYPDLALDQAYTLQLPSMSCLAAGSCEPVLLALKGQKLDKRKQEYHLRMRSFLSNLSCTKCVSWLTVVVLDAQGVPRRAYHPDLGGYRKETWIGFASFGYDITLHPDDQYLMLLSDARGVSNYAGKPYIMVDKGEVAFSLIR